MTRIGVDDDDDDDDDGLVTGNNAGRTNGDAPLGVAADNNDALPWWLNVGVVDNNDALPW